MGPTCILPQYQHVDHVSSVNADEGRAVITFTPMHGHRAPLPSHLIPLGSRLLQPAQELHRRGQRLGRRRAMRRQLVVARPTIPLRGGNKA